MHMKLLKIVPKYQYAFVDGEDNSFFYLTFLKNFDIIYIEKLRKEN